MDAKFCVVVVVRRIRSDHCKAVNAIVKHEVFRGYVSDELNLKRIIMLFLILEYI